MRISGRVPRFLFSAVLVLLVAVVYAPVGGFSFVTFDDPGYVTGNEVVLSGLTFKGAVVAFTEFRFANWHPLTWISHMADVSLFGASPAAAGAHHLVNVAFHAANVVLLFILLSSATGSVGASLTAAALFAVHPMHVESVAWVSGRKDLLSGFFGNLSLIAYVWYARKGGAGRYALVGFLLAAGLMSKAALVTWPFLMLLFDVWPLARVADGGTPSPFPRVGWARAVAEKFPLLMLSVAASVLTVLAQGSGGTVRDFVEVPLSLRLSNAAVSYVSYVGKAIWPTDLAFLYTLPASIPAWKAAGAAFLLAALTSVALAFVRRLPALAVGWFWFLGTLVPMIGIVQVGRHAMADRYAYLPYIGLYVIFAFGGAALADRAAKRVPGGSSRRLTVGTAVAVMACAVVVALTVAARAQVGVWRDSQTLFQRLVEFDPGNAWYNLGAGHLEAGDPVSAADAFRKAVEADPRHARARHLLGVVKMRAGFVAEAADLLDESVRLEPGLGGAWIDLGVARERLGDGGGALTAYERAVALCPDDTAAFLPLGRLRAARGDFDGALSVLLRGVSVKPDDRDALYTLGMVARLAGRPDMARDAEERLLRLGPRKMTTTEGSKR